MDPQAAAQLALLAGTGEKSAAAVAQLEKSLGEGEFDGEWASDLVTVLGVELADWEDCAAAETIAVVREHLSDYPRLDPTGLARWIRAHPNRPDRVAECVGVDPPDGIVVISVLSQAGSQKVVYLADWAMVQREVVLKRFIGEDAEKLMPREMQPHPLSMEHPNIIETHPLDNGRGDKFLVERRLAEVLSDGWESHGVGEAANLLHDIGAALEFLHDRPLVHGDVKPDNIGYENRRYILLDFGICRPPDEFTEEASATGSLRTRAPELLTGEARHSAKSDVWALGASVFNAFLHRFPLFEAGEAPPRVSSPEERAEYEALLGERVENEWEARVEEGVAQIDHHGLRHILEGALARKRSDRIDARELVRECKRELAAFVRGGDVASGISAGEEIHQLVDYLPDGDVLRLMPPHRRTELAEMVKALADTEGLDEADLKRIERLRGRLSTGS